MFYGREAERDHLTQRVSMMMIGIFIGAVIIIMSHDDGLPYGAFLIDSETTTGEVTRFDLNGLNRIFTYTFTDTSGAVYEKSAFISNHMRLDTDLGASINITYFPLHPDISTATELVPAQETSFMIMSAGMILIVIAIIITGLTIRQLFAHRKKDYNY
jgi:hypothetical protein